MDTSPQIWLPDIPVSVSDGMKALMNAQSLTAALRGLGHVFSVELLYLGETETADGKMFVRDVLLKLDGIAVVEARSLCGVHSAVWRTLLDCGTQPLGERLFDPAFQAKRSAFEFALAGKTADGFRRHQTARRSRFEKNGEVLQLTECFLAELDPFIG